MLSRAEIRESPIKQARALISARFGWTFRYIDGLTPGEFAEALAGAEYAAQFTRPNHQCPFLGK